MPHRVSIADACSLSSRQRSPLDGCGATLLADDKGEPGNSAGCSCADHRRPGHALTRLRHIATGRGRRGIGLPNGHRLVLVVIVTMLDQGLAVALQGFQENNLLSG